MSEPPWWSSLMAPRPVFRILAVVLCVVLLVSIMSTQYNKQYLSFETGYSSTGNSRTLVKHITVEMGIQQSPDHANFSHSEAGAITGPPSDITDLNLDSTLTLDRDSATNQRVSRVEPVVAAIPAIVHFVWCGQRYFEFKNYLSVQSIIRVLKADKLVVHYEAQPLIDQLYYHQWFMDLQHDYPFLYMEAILQEDMAVCRDTSMDQKIAILLKYLNVEGGFYVGESTWLFKLPLEDRDLDLNHGLGADNLDGFFGMRQGLSTNRTYNEILSAEGLRMKRSMCTSIGQFYAGVPDPQCLVVKGGRYESIFPMQIWDLDDPFGRVCRKIFYGTEEILMPQPSYDELVPNIGHMIWLGGGRMDFVFYLSALSMLYVVEVDTVYIHGDQEPAGEYWPRLKTNPRVKFVLRPQPTIVYNGPIEWYYRALMSDIIRVDIMIKYGGVYTDTDAIWVKPLTHEDRGYEAVASYDWVDWSYPYPDSVNFGLSYGKKNAPFWRIFRDSMRFLLNDVHGFTGVMMPYKLLEKHPDLLRIDRRLQVICYKFRCHPTYVQNYHDERNDHVSTNSIPNWHEDVYAFHWTHPNPPEYTNETTLLMSEGMFADIGKFVLKKAGLL